LATITGASFDSTTLTNFFNLTLPKIDKDVRDAIFKENTYLRYMDKAGAIDRGQTGDGCYIQFEMAENPNTAARSFSSPVPLSASDKNRAGFQQFGEYTSGIPIDYVTLKKNSGKEKLIAYLDSEKKNMIKTLKKTINNDLMNGSGAYPTTVGISQLISTSPTSGTIHGIARSGNTWVQNQQKSSACSTTDGFGVICYKEVQEVLKDASTGMGEQEFDLAVMDKTVHTNMAYYLPDLANSQRIVVESGKDVTGMQMKYAAENAFYLGDALCIWDNLAPSDSIRWINTKDFRVKVLKDADMVTAMRNSHNSFSDAILCGMALTQVSLNPRYTAVLNAFAT